MKELVNRQPTNCRTIIPKKFLYYYESSRTHNIFSNLGIWQRDWELPENLTLEASGFWLENSHQTGERLLESTNKTLCTPGERSSDPTRDWPRFACEYPGVSGRGVGWQQPPTDLGALSVSVCAQDLFKKITIVFITSTIVWSQVKQQGGNTAPPINRKLD